MHRARPTLTYAGTFGLVLPDQPRAAAVTRLSILTSRSSEARKVVPLLSDCHCQGRKIYYLGHEVEYGHVAICRRSLAAAVLRHAALFEPAVGRIGWRMDCAAFLEGCNPG